MTSPKNQALRTGEELELAFALRPNPGAYSLLVGAGISRSSGVPFAYGESHPSVRAGFAGGEVSTLRAAVSVLDSALVSYA